MQTHMVTDFIEITLPDGTTEEIEVEREQRLIEGIHCQQCASTDPEDTIYSADEGYSGCCNEILVLSCREGVCYHP